MTLVKRSHVSSRSFIVLTLVLTWLFWIPAGLLRLAEPAPIVLALHYLGGLAPLVVALGLIYRRHSRREQRDYLRRVIDYGRIRPPWYAAIFLVAPALTGAGALADILLGGHGATLEAAARFLEAPLGLIPYALFLLLFGPLPEELAWRGYALDELQKRHSALVSSLIIGVVWTLWHLPLFFIQGSYQHGLSLGTPQFWLYNAALVPESVILTWIFNNNRRSTLSAILFHFMINFTGELFALTLRVELFTIISWYLLAAGVVVWWGPARLVRLPRDRKSQQV